MAFGVGGGWRGPETSIGGMARTFGLRNRDVGGDEGASVRMDAAQLRRVGSYLMPYWKQWLVIFACIAATAALGVLPPLAVRGILDNAIPKQDMNLLYLLVGAIIALNILSGLIGVLQNYVNAVVGLGIVFDLRSALFQHLQRMSLPFYTTTRAGEIVSRINNDVGAVQGTATATLISIVSNVLTVVATAIVIFGMNWRLALLSIVIVPLLYLPTRSVGKYRRRLSKAQ